jgi:hypothetical protein
LFEEKQKVPMAARKASSRGLQRCSHENESEPKEKKQGTKKEERDQGGISWDLNFFFLNLQTNQKPEKSAFIFKGTSWASFLRKFMESKSKREQVAFQNLPLFSQNFAFSWNQSLSFLCTYFLFQIKRCIV